MVIIWRQYGLSCSIFHKNTCGLVEHLEEEGGSLQFAVLRERSDRDVFISSIPLWAYKRRPGGPRTFICVHRDFMRSLRILLFHPPVGNALPSSVACVHPAFWHPLHDRYGLGKRKTAHFRVERAL